MNGQWKHGTNGRTMRGGNYGNPSAIYGRWSTTTTFSHEWWTFRPALYIK